MHAKVGGTRGEHGVEWPAGCSRVRERETDRRKGEKRGKRGVDDVDPRNFFIFNQILTDMWIAFTLSVATSCRHHVSRTTIQTTLGPYLCWFWELRGTPYLVAIQG